MSKQHSSIRAYGILVHEGAVALVRSSNPNHNPPLWWLPGGGQTRLSWPGECG